MFSSVLLDIQLEEGPSTVNQFVSSGFSIASHPRALARRGRYARSNLRQTTFTRFSVCPSVNLGLFPAALPLLISRQQHSGRERFSAQTSVFLVLIPLQRHSARPRLITESHRDLLRVSVDFALALSFIFVC